MISTEAIPPRGETGADPIVVDRVRAAIRGGAGSALVFGLAAPWLAPAGGARFVGATIMAVALQAAALSWLRRDPTPRRAALVGELLCATVIVLSIAGGMALGQRFTTPMIPIVVAMGTGSFIPWGVKSQLRVALVASAGVLLHLAWLGSTPSGYPPLVALLGIGLSVPMAGMVARDRAQLLSLAEKRRLADERFQSLAASTPEVFWWLAPDGRKLSYVSPAFERIWEVPVEQVVRDPLSLRDSVLPEDRERMTAAFSGLRTHGFEEEFRIVRRDGSIRTLHTRAYVAPAPDGTPRISGVTEDVTEKRATEEALRASERRYAGLVDNAPDPIVTFDGHGRARSANPATARLFGWSASDLLALRPFRFLRVVAPGSRATVLRVIRELVTRGAAAPAEIELVRSDGERVLVETNQRLLTSMSGEVEVQVILRDITERRRAEEAARLRDLNAHMEDVRERGRRYLAQRMHDDLAQPLAALRLEMMWGTRHFAHLSGVDETLAQKLSGLVESVIGAARAMIADLRPSVLDDFGLAAAVSWQARTFEEQHGITCSTAIATEDVPCDEERSIALFRSLQEILGALARDPGLTRVDVALHEVGDDVVLAVRAQGIDGEHAEIPTTTELERIRERIRRFDGGVEHSAPAGGPIELAIHVRRQATTCLGAA
ncbi:PAS domain S-box protein [Candidatus Binatia bacterium]|nr:PAS domain S-box protein [Candidatus Binatia bacterium]